MIQKILLTFLLLSGCAHPNFRHIKGENFDGVRQVKGEPDTMLTENGHAMWVYRKDKCMQTVFFDNDSEAVDFYEFGECSVEK